MDSKMALSGAKQWGMADVEGEAFMGRRGLGKNERWRVFDNSGTQQQIFKTEINKMSEEYNVMSVGGWPCPNNNASSIDFTQIFTNPALNAITFLNTENVVEECKRQSTLLTQKLISNPPLLKDLLNICLRPSSPENKFSAITNLHTYRALEILTSIDTEELSEYLLGSKLPHSQEQEENVITEESEQNKVQSLPIVENLFSMLEEKKPIEETRLWYMYKIGSSICYQKPKQMLDLFRKNKQISEMLFQHSYSNSILEWMIKLMEVEDSNTFFQAEKVVIFRYFVETMQLQEIDPELDMERLANYQMLLTNLLEKVEERFEKSKYIKLCKIIFNEKYPISFIVTRLSSKVSSMETKQEKPILDEEITHLLAITQKYLHFSQKYKPAMLNNIHNSISPARSSNNIGQTGSNLDASVVMDITLENQCFSRIKEQVELLQMILVQRANTNFLFPVSRLVCFLKLFKAVLFILEPTDHTYLEKLFTPESIQYLLTSTTAYTNCTILHNTIKDILIEGVSRNYDAVVSILLDRQKSSFLDLISQIKGKTNAGDQQYENQLYHVFKAILKKGQDSPHQKILSDFKANIPAFENFQTRIREKETIYTTLIAGNPRKQSSCIDQEEEVDRMLPYNSNPQQALGQRKIIDDQPLSPSVNDIIEGNTEHWFDCGGLPLDSDSSKDDLQNPGAKSDEILDGNSSEKRSEIITSELSKRFKNMGVLQCEEKELRVLVSQDGGGYKIAQASKKKQKKIPKQLKDKQQQELENQIKILEDKRHYHEEHHQNRKKQHQPESKSPEGATELKKQVDSFDSIGHESEQKIEPRNTKDIIDVSGILEISGNKEQAKHASQLSQLENPITSHSKASREVKQKEGEESREQNCEQNQNHPFITYLSFQINQILSEMD